MKCANHCFDVRTAPHPSISSLSEFLPWQRMQFRRKLEDVPDNPDVLIPGKITKKKKKKKTKKPFQLIQ